MVAEPSLWTLRRGRHDPLAFLTALAQRGDFVPFSLAGRSAFLLNRPDYVDAVLVSQASHFVKGSANKRAQRLLGSGLFTAEGTLHGARRRAIQPAFARQRFAEYGSTMVAHTERLRSAWAEGDVIELCGTASRLTFGIIGQTIVGADVEWMYEDVRSALRAVTATLNTLLSLIAPMRRVRPEQARLHRVVDRLLREAARREGSLLELLEGSPYDQLRDDVLTILLAGHDTISNALTWTWLLLASNPHVEARLRQEVRSVVGDRLPNPADLPGLAYTKNVLAESLRLYPPAWIIARHALDTRRFDAGVVPKGSLVLVSQYLLHRDPRHFADPLRFDPDRWLTDPPRMAFFPFGAGARACIGEAFGWMEGVLVLATIAQRWRLTPLDRAQPEIDARITLRPKHEVRMRIESWD